MNTKIIFILIIITAKINYIINQNNNTEIKDNYRFNAVYRIDSLKNGNSLNARDSKLDFSPTREGKERNFRIIPADSDLYYIESKAFNKKLGVNLNDEVSLFEKYDSDEFLEETYWNITKINENEYIIENNYTKKFLENSESKLICQKNFSKLFENDNNTLNIISNSLKFSFFKLCEEVQLKPEHIEIIEKEPVDVVIKYIDLSDKMLNREGIKQIKKDEDNEELKYCVRSIFENIPWIRKIFIIMPNERVRFFKPIEEIKDKFVYVKDKDLIGFDSSNSNVFQYNLYKMSKFGLSENFILKL